MSGKDRQVFEAFKAPSTDPIIENELARIDMLRCVLGDSVPPLTLAGVLALGIALIDDRREEVRLDAHK